MAAGVKYIGGGTGTLALDDAVFAERFHGPLVHEAVRAELAARRRGTASTKTRGEVKVNRKARRRALRAALSVHAERGSIAAVDPSKFDTPSTKAAAAALAKFDGDGRVLVVLTDGEETCLKSFRNLVDVIVLHADQVGVADVVGAGRIVVSEAALARLTEKAVAK
jgi:large subunit ribosomal protein L4